MKQTGLCLQVRISLKFWAKKTPLGRRGVRVIVVVANPVSVSALRPVDYYFFYGLLLLLLYILLIAPFLLASMSENRCRVPGVTETFFVRTNI